MNYRHSYHAGNHADVLKHVVLARVVEYLAAKDKPFAMLDAHAGLGTYDLQGTEAGKTGEWLTGVGLMGKPFAANVEAVLAPWRAAIAALNAGALRFYPGSPEVALHLMRASDRVIANELHPQEALQLRRAYAGEKRLVVTEMDAAQAVKSQLPLREKRGLVLIDPPYEVADETDRVARMLLQGVKRMATGVFIIWYPVTTEAFVARLMDKIAATGVPDILRAELRVKNTHEHSGLSGSGLLIVNPPYTLEPDLGLLLPALAERLGVEGLGQFSLGWLNTPRQK